MLLREGGKLAHGPPFLGGFTVRSFKPPAGLQFSGEAPPEAAPVVQGPIPVGSQAVMVWLLRDFVPGEQSHKHFL